MDRAHPAPFSVGEDYRGHELTRRIGDFGFGEVHPRALYRTLGRMEREDLVVSERDGLDHGPTRRWYSITAPGESYLESWSDSLARYQEEIGLFFALYEGAAGGAAGCAVEGRILRGAENAGGSEKLGVLGEETRSDRA